MNFDLNSELNIDINAWWRSLDVSWKNVFKGSIDINHNPAEEEIRAILNLEAVDITGKSRIISLEPLQYFRGLRKLNLSKTKIQTLDKIKELTLIDELDCSFSEVNSLAPIGGFKNLWRLNCSNTKIQSLAGLENLADLEYLDCSGTGVVDLTPLYGLNKLKMVRCDFTKVNDISILQLRNLSLSYAETPAETLKEKIELLEDRDALFDEAAKLVVMHQQGSTSLIQRKLKLGYNRTGRIIDQLEAAGIIGPFEGGKSREVLIRTDEDLMKILDSNLPEIKIDIFEVAPVQSEAPPVQFEVQSPKKEYPSIHRRKSAFTNSDRKNAKILVSIVLALSAFIFFGRLARTKTETESALTGAMESTRDAQKVEINKLTPGEGKTRTIVTIDGYDPASKEVIDPINLWGNYQTRTVVGKVRHKEQVYFLGRDGDGVFIETSAGVRGWVTYFFIEGFK